MKKTTLLILITLTISHLLANSQQMADINTNNNSKKIKFIAHRGESKDAPENSLSAFKLALARNVDCIETDIHLTADGQIVCIHDANALRTSKTNMSIQKSTYAQLQKLNFNNGMANYHNEKIPLLEELLKLIKPNNIFIIEIKSKDIRILKKMAEVVKKSKIPSEQLRIISFNMHMIKESKKYMPEIKTQLLRGLHNKNGVITPDVNNLISQLKKCKADGIGLSKANLTKNYFDTLKKAGYTINIWTIDDIKTAKYVINLGADYITSNCPTKLKKELEE